MTIILHLILTIVIVIGNGLVIIAYFTNSSVRAVPFNRYILSLAAADFMVGVTSVPLFARDVILYDVELPMLTYITFRWCFRFPLVLSVFVITMMTHDRLMLASDPIKYHTSKCNSRTNRYILRTWIACLAYSSMHTILAVLVAEVILPKDGELFTPVHHFLTRAFVDFIESIFNFVVPLLILITLNLIFIVKLRRSLQIFKGDQYNAEAKLKDQPRTVCEQVTSQGKSDVIISSVSAESKYVQTSTVTKHKGRSESNLRRVARNLFLLVSIYLLCWVPMNVIIALALFSIFSPFVVLHFAMVIVMSNSAVNPLLYAVTSAKYRHAMLQVCRGSQKKKQKATRNDLESTVGANYSIRQSCR